jgi:hypothetical protein
MTPPLNRDRAAWAEAAILKFMNETGVDGDREAVADLIADLGHYCDRHQLDFVHLLKRGIGHWHIEQRDPEGIDALPEIGVIIDGEAQP